MNRPKKGMNHEYKNTKMKGMIFYRLLLITMVSLSPKF